MVSSILIVKVYLIFLVGSVLSAFEPSRIKIVHPLPDETPPFPLHHVHPHYTSTVPTAGTTTIALASDPTVSQQSDGEKLEERLNLKPLENAIPTPAYSPYSNSPCYPHPLVWCAQLNRWFSPKPSLIRHPINRHPTHQPIEPTSEADSGANP